MSFGYLINLTINIVDGYERITLLKELVEV